MYGQTEITIVGNLADDPEIRFTPGGHAVCKFRVIVTPRVKRQDGQGFEDGQPSSFPCVAWREIGEHVAESLKRGSRVIVQGDFGQAKPYEGQDGVKRYPWELNVQAIGPDLRYAVAKVQKMDRASTGAVQTTAGGGEDAWTTQTGPGREEVQPAF